MEEDFGTRHWDVLEMRSLYISGNEEAIYIYIYIYFFFPATLSPHCVWVVGTASCVRTLTHTNLNEEYIYIYIYIYHNPWLSSTSTSDEGS